MPKQSRADREEELRLAATVEEGLSFIELYFKQPAGQFSDRDLAKSVARVHEAFGALRMLDAQVDPAWQFEVVTAAIAQLNDKIRTGGNREALQKVWRELIKQVQVKLRTNPPR